MAHLGVLGPLEMRGGRGRLRVGGAIQRTVLGVLVAADRTVTVDALIDATWGGDAPHSAEHALESHVSRIRGALRDLPGSRVERRPLGYHLVVPDGLIDAALFTAHAVAARQARAAGDVAAAATQADAALRLWRGAPYLDVRPSPVVTAEVTRLEDLRLELLELRATAALAAGKAAEVLPELVRVTEEEPYRERLWVLLARTLEAVGRHLEALEALRRVSTLLRSEFGVEPGSELQQLHVQLLRGQGPSAIVVPEENLQNMEAVAADPAIRRSQMKRSLLRRHPGRLSRSRAMQLPRGLLPGNERMSGDGPAVGRDRELVAMDAGLAQRGVALVGARGVGKTWLLRESLRRVEREERHWGWAVATESAAHIPFGALAHLLPSHLPPTNILRAAAEHLLATLGADAVLAVDDAHLLDATSAALIHHLLVVGKIPVVLALRSGSSAPDAITSLLKEGVVRRIDVGPLGRRSTHELLEAVLHAQVEELTAQRLWTLTEGNPLFLQEVARAGRDAGSLVARDGVWRWHGSFAAVGGLEQLVDRRLEALDPEQRAAMELVAHAETLGVGIADRLLSATAMESLERLGMLTAVTDGRRVLLQSPHPIYGEVIRAATSPRQRQRLCRLLSDALEDVGARRSGDLLRLATWHRAGDGPQRADLLLAAARQAMAAMDLSLAEELAAGAFAAERAFEAGLLLAQTQVAQGRADEVEALLARLEGEPGTAAQRSQAALARAQNLALNMGAPERAVDVLEAAELAIGDPFWRQHLTGGRTYVLSAAGRLQEAIATGERHLTSDDLAPQAAAWGAAGTSAALIYSGHTRAARALMARFEDNVAEGVSAGVEQAIGFDFFRFLADFLDGEVVTAHTHAEEHLRSWADQGAVAMQAIWSLMAGVCDLAMCNLGSAVRRLRDAVGPFRAANVQAELPIVLGNLAYAMALAGDGPEAARLADEAEHVQHDGARYAFAHVARGRVWVTCAQGQQPRAVSLALAAAHELGAMQHRMLQAWLLHDVVRLDSPAPVVDELQYLASACDGRLVPAFAAHAKALATAQGAQLDEVARAFEAMGARLLAAEASAHAARSHLQRQDNAASLAAINRARRLQDACGGAMTPALLQLDSDEAASRNGWHLPPAEVRDVRFR